MSETTTETRTLQAVPAPEPQTSLTGAPASVYAELIASPGATAAELALATGIGRSTAGKALTALEEQGLAIREEGERSGARRTPDRWRSAQSGDTRSGKIGVPDSAVSATPDESSATDSAGTDDVTEADTFPTPVDEPDAGATAQTTAQVEAPRAPMTNKDAVVADAACADAAPTKPPAESSTCTAATVRVAVLAPKTRMAPGALRQKVIDHLQAHPDDAFTATGISRVIERSSGAIANALAILVRQGIAEQVSDAPRTHRLATPGAATE
ncbi:MULTISPECIES: MarR family transcriptional regulator [unclassified Streptomyces]|uniref:MarR family transcriptional regulator n=1 Tax=unclassified Streptomyces TaxID=2593676 RepID=UPI0033F93196